MPALESLKRKITSAEDLESVVKTMKTLAAVSIRQYETAVESLAEYFQTVELGLRMLLWDNPDPPRLAVVDGRAGAVVFGSDQGMCGQFNEQIVTYTLDHLQSPKGRTTNWSFLAVGVRAAGRLEDAGLTVDGEISLPGSATGITETAQQLLLEIEAWRTHRRLGRIVLFHNRRQATSYQPHQSPLLPIDPRQFYRMKKRNWPSRALPMYTMDQSQLFSLLIRQYLFVSLFRAFAESLAAENASRIVSMQAAAHNIEERLVEIRGQYNQLRQTSITEELLDVVTGFEALTQESQ